MGKIPVGGRCLLFVRFTPRKVGTRAAVLRIRSNSSGGTVVIGLIGSGTHSHKR